MPRTPKTIPILIDDFSKGIVSDPRGSSGCRMVKNFDAHSYKKKLVPLATSVTGDASASTNKIQNFTVAEYSTAEDYRLFGLGVSGTKAKVFVNASFNSATWAALTNGIASTHDSVDFELFIYYRKTDRIYGAADGTTIWCCDSADVQAFDETDGSDEFAHTLATAYKNPRKDGATKRPYITGLVHTKDDSLYIAYDNIIIRYNSVTSVWDDPALTLPTDRIITSISEYGNYLAIGTKSVDDVGSSRVYLWDRNSSVNDISESIDWGEGNLHVLREINGQLIGISTTGTAATVLKSRLTFRYYIGGKPIIFKQLVSEDIYLLSDLTRTNRKVNDYLYFFLKLKVGGTTQEGIWKVGKHIETGEMALSLAYPVNNGTALTGTNELHNLMILGDAVYLSYTEDGSLAMDFISGLSTTYTANSTYESLIFNGGNSAKTKTFKGATVMHEYLPANGQIVLKYKKDNETSWSTALVTNTTDGEIRSSAIKIIEFKEIQFQILSTGGAVVTGLKFQYETKEDDIYG